MSVFVGKSNTKCSIFDEDKIYFCYYENSIQSICIGCNSLRESFPLVSLKTTPVGGVWRIKLKNKLKSILWSPFTPALIFIAIITELFLLFTVVHSSWIAYSVIFSMMVLVFLFSFRFGKGFERFVCALFKIKLDE